MDRFQKKSLDIWLNDKGFYRKHVALDETCLFRAVSDQINSSQLYHEDIRKQCVQFARNNLKLFQDLFQGIKMNEYLENLEKHFVVCGNIEIQILSRMLKQDFIVIDAHTFESENVTKNGYDKVIRLCRSRDGHFDSILQKENIENAAFCQSLAYKILYENVFGMENVDDIVNTMLYPNDEKSSPENFNLFDFITLPTSESGIIDEVPTPFPYKVAKALDPDQYRNIEYDTWNQLRKENRFKDWYMGGNDFKVGTKCHVMIDNQNYECYIQEMSNNKQENVCSVHVVKLAKKMVVPLQQLKPLPDAKPWPLPYTVLRNNPKAELPVIVEEDKEDTVEVVINKNNNKKRRNKRRGQNRNNNNRKFNNRYVNDRNNNKNDVKCLEGCPLIANGGAESVDTTSNSTVDTKFDTTNSSSGDNEPYLSEDANTPHSQSFNNSNVAEDFGIDEDWFYQYMIVSKAPPVYTPSVFNVQASPSHNPYIPQSFNPPPSFNPQVPPVFDQQFHPEVPPMYNSSPLFDQEMSEHPLFDPEVPACYNPQVPPPMPLYYPQVPYPMPSVYVPKPPVNSFTTCNNAVFESEDDSKRVTTVYTKYTETTFKHPVKPTVDPRFTQYVHYCPLPCCNPQGPVLPYQPLVPEYQQAVPINPNLVPSEPVFQQSVSAYPPNYASPMLENQLMSYNQQEGSECSEYENQVASVAPFHTYENPHPVVPATIHPDFIPYQSFYPTGPIIPPPPAVYQLHCSPDCSCCNKFLENIPPMVPSMQPMMSQIKYPVPQHPPNMFGSPAVNLPPEGQF